MVEMALVSSRKIRLEAQANKGDKKAREALDLANHPDKFISTTQIGITLTAILNGIFSADALTDSLAKTLNGISFIGHYSEAVATAIIVMKKAANIFFMLWFGSLVVCVSAEKSSWSLTLLFFLIWSIIW